MRRKFKFGQSLIEVVVAVGIVAVAVVALVSAIIFTQKTARSANLQTQATKLAEESIEQIRVVRDRRGFSYLVNDSCWKLVITDPADPTTWNFSNTAPNICPEIISLGNIAFSRSIKIEDGSNSRQKKVTITVSWQESGGVRSVINSTFFSNCLGTSC